ncbi:MAG: SOS response-associated peptidase [Gammaproteobacteria bacterium]
MCGRFALHADPDELGALFSLRARAEIEPRYNIAPSQQIAVVGVARDLVSMRWGITPFWSERDRRPPLLINARSETLDRKPSFRDALRRRRCLVPANGFYEWKRSEKPPRPYYISRQDGQAFAFAAIWQHEPHPPACALLTQAALGSLCDIHQRMPVILSPEDYSSWLDPNLNDRALLRATLQHALVQELAAYPVSHRVNDPRNDDPACVTALPCSQENSPRPAHAL